MSLTSQLHDPLTINLHKQTRALTAVIPPDSPLSAALINAPSYKFLLDTLSTALALPALTLSVATAFRPILLDLCARWLHSSENTEEQLVALCLLLEFHEELFP